MKQSDDGYLQSVVHVVSYIILLYSYGIIELGRWCIRVGVFMLVSAILVYHFTPMSSNCLDWPEEAILAE